MVGIFPRKLTISLGLFSGSSLSACWISVHTSDYIGAISVGTVTCAIILILLRFEPTAARRARRRGDGDDGTAAI